MALLRCLAVIGGILSILPAVNAGFSAGSSGNVAVYWGISRRITRKTCTDAFQVKTPMDKGQDLLLSNGYPHTALVSRLNPNL